MTRASPQGCRPLRFLRNFAVAWGLLLVCIGVLWLGATFAANRRYARAEAAYRASGLPATAEALRGPRLSDADNAAVGFLSAAVRLGAVSPSGSSVSFESRYIPYPASWWTLADASAAANGPAIAAAIAAAKLPRSDWGVDVTNPSNSSRALDDSRSLALVLADETLRRHFTGDEAGAFDAFEAQEALALSWQREPGLIPCLVAIGIEDARVSNVPQMAADLKIPTGSGAFDLSRVHAHIERLQQPSFAIPANTWSAEYLWLAANHATFYSSRLLMRPMTTAVHAASIERVLSGHQLMLDRAPSSPGNPRGSIPGESGPFGAVRGVTRLSEVSHRIQLKRNLAAAALAVALYRHDHAGKWPASARDLIPAYLPAFPADPGRIDGGPLDYGLLGPNRLPTLRGVGGAGTLPTSHPSPGNGPNYGLTRVGPRSDICVWIDLATFPPPPPASQPSTTP